MGRVWPLFSILCLEEQGGYFLLCISGYKGVALIFLFCALGSRGVALLFFLFGRGVAPISVLYLGEGVALIFYPVYIYIDRAKFISAVLFNTVNLLGFYSNLSSRTHALPTVLHVETTDSPSSPVYLVSTQLAKCCSQCL